VGNERHTQCRSAATSGIIDPSATQGDALGSQRTSCRVFCISIPSPLLWAQFFFSSFLPFPTRVIVLLAGIQYLRQSHCRPSMILQPSGDPIAQCSAHEYAVEARVALDSCRMGGHGRCVYVHFLGVRTCLPEILFWFLSYRIEFDHCSHSLAAFKALLDLLSGKVPIQSWADHICLVTYTISV
jgi:hypothetical protein